MTDALLLNIGNTSTQLALAQGGSILSVTRLDTERLLQAETLPLALLSPSRPPCLAACVVPGVEACLRALPQRAPIRFLSPELVDTVDFSSVDASTLGGDRIANAVAAVHFGHLPVIVVDCGTAITTEIIDAGRCFLGGTIMPGRRLLRMALARHTAQLPEIALTEEDTPVFGTTTADAICAGCDQGAAGAIERILRQSRASLGAPDCAAVAIGGDARYFSGCVPGLQFGPEDFTLRGLAVVADRVFG